jgi:hypothetical protein
MKKRIDIQKSLKDKTLKKKSQEIFELNQRAWDGDKNEPFTI